jgi:hypothetical protein
MGGDMKKVHWRLTAFGAWGLLAAGACGGSHPAGTTGSGGTPGTGATSSSSTSTTSSSSTGTTSGAAGAGGCPDDSRVFGVCTGPDALPNGPGAPGAPCQTETDCEVACCPCPHGQIHYAYLACTCGECASICNPVNDTVAGACQGEGGEGGGDGGGGCLACTQILAIVLAEGDPDQVGPRACQGAASAAWGALGACAAASCGSVCPGIMPSSACVACFERPDTAGGCATEVAACQAN